jgi:hypothetical protein
VSLVVRQARCQAGWAHCTNAAILHDARHAAWCRVLSAVTFVCVGGKAAQGMWTQTSAWLWATCTCRNTSTTSPEKRSVPLTLNCCEWKLSLRQY